MKAFGKYAAISIGLLFLIFLSNGLGVSHAVTFPSNIIYYANLTISNSQPGKVW